MIRTASLIRTTLMGAIVGIGCLMGATAVADETEREADRVAIHKATQSFVAAFEMGDAA